MRRIYLITYTLISIEIRKINYNNILGLCCTFHSYLPLIFRHEKSSNVGYYICKHLGSDCDEESDTTKTDTENSSNATAAQNAQKDRKSDNSSEEEWTYTANEHSGSSSETVTSIQLHKSVESLKQDVELVKPKINQEVTKKLIADVDKFVSPSKKALRLNLTNSEQCSSKPGHFRMNSWLRQCRNDDNMVGI